ncbi:NAD/NADP octopine/nopaline dehydrogenase family protein [Schinkia azotoformans]|uniref:NAD/NADP-dependent octopine/nopaline dehydrogenase family protein n=1 Tax=Schinkia azotoformans TaxID=1454 RepID=UPI002DB68FCA|nr:NAD/NADP octopine/nopaline dehydrogenase family protein [Schinkia azotoformans]MEC1719008.1 NAD/NADP octopine/nopaline dehydrogenase family protein [Schinkia azotoformans]MED4352230.1 NAD/NADP octopine/nopaline dehydrogenase family protein [Schinkia azotoformans]MED4411962.1 NAD/NADP octopine/nopaline dehydrogenase family protein [Schinkia azotoformans]
MGKMDYLKNMPVAVLGAGAVGKTIAADATLAGQEVRLYDAMPFAEKSLANLEKTGIELDGIQRNLYNFKRSGLAKIDVITTDIAEAVKGAGHIVIAIPAFGHEPLFKSLIPVLEDGQVINIFTDNFGTLLLRKMMRETGCTTKVIVGGWSSAPYGTRIESVGGFMLPHVGVKYRAITLRGATLPMTDADDFIEASKYLSCMDAVTYGDGAVKGDTVLDIGFSNINPVIHVPATLLGVSTMENWGKIFGDFDKSGYSMYAHALCPSICEVQYQFYNEEIKLAEGIGVDLPRYSYESFFSRRSVLAQEYMGLDKDGKDNMILPLDQPTTEANTGPNSIHHRYCTEDVPVGCKVYHELGVQYGISTPIIDSMIVLAGAMLKKNYFEEGYSLEYLGIKDMDKETLLDYLNNGNYPALLLS